MAVTEHPVYPVLWRDGRGRDRGTLAHPGRRGRTIHSAVGVGVRLMARPSTVLLLPEKGKVVPVVRGGALSNGAGARG